MGIAIVAVLLWRYDARPILRILSRERPAYFAAVVVLYVAGQAMCAYRWQLLAALLKVHGRYGEFVAYTFVGMFTNLFVPGLLPAMRRDPSISDGALAEWARLSRRWLRTAA